MDTSWNVPYFAPCANNTVARRPIRGGWLCRLTASVTLPSSLLSLPNRFPPPPPPSHAHTLPCTVFRAKSALVEGKKTLTRESMGIWESPSLNESESTKEDWSIAIYKYPAQKGMEKLWNSIKSCVPFYRSSCFHDLMSINNSTTFPNCDFNSR